MRAEHCTTSLRQGHYVRTFVEAIRKPAALQGHMESAVRKVVAIGETLAERTRTVPAQSPHPWPGPRLQRVANGGSVVASPGTRNSNRLLGWLRGMASLRQAAGAAA